MNRPRIAEAHEFSTHPLGAVGVLNEGFAGDSISPCYSMKHTPTERIRFSLSQLRQALIDEAMDNLGDDGRSISSPEDENRWKAHSALIERMDKYLLKVFNVEGVKRQAMPTLKGYLDAALE